MPKRTSKRVHKRWTTPRRYATPKGDRLNVAAIAQQFHIKPKAFVHRQMKGWPNLGGARLVAESTNLSPPGRGGARFEDTFLESEVERATRPTRPARGRYQLADGRFVLNMPATMRALKRSYSIVWKWRSYCPYRPNKPLKPLPIRFRSPETGSKETVYDEDGVREVQAAIAATGLTPSEPGELRIAREKLMQDLSLNAWSVLLFERKGLLHRRETPRRLGRPQILYLHSDYDKLRMLLADRQVGHHREPHGVFLRVKSAVEQYGWKPETLIAYELYCPCLPKRKLVPEWFIDPLSISDRPRKFYNVADLDTIRAAKANGFNGCYQTGEGKRFNLKIASKRTGLAIGRLYQYLGRCGLLPEGKLRTVKMRPPNLGGWEHTILDADLDRLAQAVSDAVRKSKSTGQWKTVAEIGRGYGVTTGRALTQVYWLLQAAHAAGELSATEITRHFSGRRGRIRKRLHFDVDELDRLLAGRGLVEVANEFAQAKPSGECVAEAEPVAVLQEAPRFRRTNKNTLEMYRVCHDGLYVRRDPRKVVWKEAIKLFGDKGLSAESSVTMNATRYKKTEEFWRRSQPGGDLHVANAPKNAGNNGGIKIE
jgi:hypothetical protein